MTLLGNIYFGVDGDVQYIKGEASIYNDITKPYNFIGWGEEFDLDFGEFIIIEIPFND